MRAVYADWLDAGATPVPGGGPGQQQRLRRRSRLTDWPAGTCVIFSDGLRFDIGRRDRGGPLGQGFRVDGRSRDSPHCRRSPDREAGARRCRGASSQAAASPRLDGGGPDLTIAGLRAAARRRGLPGPPGWRHWETRRAVRGRSTGDIDEPGSRAESKLPALIDGEVPRSCERIARAARRRLAPGRVVTDHGWLYLPGGLPKVELPQHLTKDAAMRKARLRRLDDGSGRDLQTVPWTWDPRRVDRGPAGHPLLQAGQVYEHGGFSPQECVTPVHHGPARLRHRRRAGCDLGSVARSSRGRVSGGRSGRSHRRPASEGGRSGIIVARRGPSADVRGLGASSSSRTKTRSERRRSSWCSTLRDA